MVLELGEHDLIARLEVLLAPAARDEVERLGDVLREDRAARISADELRGTASRALVGGIGILREAVDATVDVRVVVRRKRRHAVDDGRRLLRARAGVEVDDLAPVLVAEHGELRADRRLVEPRGRGLGLGDVRAAHAVQASPLRPRRGSARSRSSRSARRARGPPSRTIRPSIRIDVRSGFTWCRIRW